MAQLADPDPQVRQAAVKALGQPGDARARPALLALLTNQKQSARLRLAALRALVRLAQPHPLPHLLTALQDPSVQVRKAAVNALIHLKDPNAVVAWIVALSDTDFEIRRRAAEALEKLGDTRAVAPLLADSPPR